MADSDIITSKAANAISKADMEPLNVHYYESYFQVVEEISNEMGLGFMTLSPEQQLTLKRLLYDYGILQDRRNANSVTKIECRRAPSKKVKPIKLIIDNTPS